MTEVSRRTILKGAAYTVPTVALLSMTSVKAEAASMPPTNGTNVPNQPVTNAGTSTLPHTGMNFGEVAAAGAGAVILGSAAVIASKASK